MRLFKRTPKEDIIIQPAQHSRVEVEVAKNASSQAAQTAKKINEHVKDLFDENGFTIKIFIAAGGHPPKHRKIQ